ncbi:MAG: glutamine synthetase family protein [Bacteroidota bacterium]
MNKKQILQAVSNHPAGKVKIAYSDIDGILRGKYVSTEKFLSIAEKGSTFCDVIFGWDAADVTYDNGTYTGWHSGYPDSPARIDLSTFRQIPWEDNLPFFLGELMGPEGKPAAVDPRQLLQRVVAAAEGEGFSPTFSQEFEWFNFAETPQTARDKHYQELKPITPGMFGYSVLRTTLQNPFFKDLFDLLTKFGIPIEGLHTETGPGVLEAAIRYAPALEAADRAILFKTAVKEIAYRHGFMATFMAKISEHLPGCGGHVHQSLWSNNKTNAFYDAKDKHGMSETMRQYIAGQLHCLPYILPMYAPTLNSYKRLVEGAWAPTTLTWGVDNRTVALRVLSGSASSCRLETRVIGSDANPYLAMSAALASGLYGIRKKLKLKQPASVGNGYTDLSNGILPGTLEAATRKMKESPIAGELFGEGFADHFTRTREWEWRQHLKSVTDWEFKRYFEII